MSAHLSEGQALRIKHTVCWREKPLLCIENLPGLFAELTPAQARAMASVLLKAADDCEAQHARTRLYGPQRQEYPL